MYNSYQAPYGKPGALGTVVVLGCVSGFRTTGGQAGCAMYLAELTSHTSQTLSGCMYQVVLCFIRLYCENLECHASIRLYC